MAVQGINFKFPFQRDSNFGYGTPTQSKLEARGNDIIVLVNTMYGERFDTGTTLPLRNLLFENITPQFKQTLQNTIADKIRELFTDVLVKEITAYDNTDIKELNSNQVLIKIKLTLKNNQDTNLTLNIIYP